MLSAIHPKLPMRNKAITRNFYLEKLGFQIFGNGDFDGYLMIEKEKIQIHFFEYQDLDPLKNYGQVYIRTNDVDALYQEFISKEVSIHPGGVLENKPWGQREFSILDPDHNLLTFGQEIFK